MNTIVLDTGGFSCKIGLAGSPNPTRVVPNCAVRAKRGKHLFVGDQLDEIVDYSSMLYRRPIEKGFVVNMELQSEIWTRLFGKPVMNLKTEESSLLLTEAPFCPPAIQKSTDEIMFEKFQFRSCYRASGAGLVPYSTDFVQDSPSSEASVVVDSGFSFTHVVPVFKGRPVNYAIRRIDVGGKLLTNYLKEIVSFRTWNMMDETHLVNRIKEKLSLCALNFPQELQRAKKTLSGPNSIRRQYVLPSGSNMSGYVLEDEKTSVSVSSSSAGQDQMLPLNNERIVLPELLFNPSDIGREQAGISESVVQAIEACPPELYRSLYSNILLVGGNSNIPRYQQRIENDLRTLAPSTFEIRTRCSPKCGKGHPLLHRDLILRRFVSREQSLMRWAPLCASENYTFDRANLK